MMVITLEESRENERYQPTKIQYSIGCRVSDQEEKHCASAQNVTEIKKNIYFGI